jgi:hypothetical protein
MTKYNEENEPLKRAYFHHLAAARGLSEASIGVVASAIGRFEHSTGFRSFKRFHIEQAIAFRRKMDEATNARDGKPLSKGPSCKPSTHYAASSCGWRSSPAIAAESDIPTRIFSDLFLIQKRASRTHAGE